jgi:hypothetical protein
MQRIRQSAHTLTLALVALGVAAIMPAEARKPARAAEQAPSSPEIRLSASNQVPACITPERLMRTLAERNEKLDDRYKAIAHLYKKHGESWRVRWDYAFYQMVLETNYLMYRRGDGTPGDVKPRQNNFAGIGATGNGVPGDSFPDVSTGVLAQIQHLVAYSGEKVANAAAPRTREHGDDIAAKSQRLGRPVRFADLTNRWAADRNYAKSIETIAGRFFEAACRGQPPQPEMAGVPRTSSPVETASVGSRGRELARQAIDETQKEPAAKAALGGAKVPSGGGASPCKVMAASYGGSGVTLLIRAASTSGVTFTALGVDGSAEQPMAESYIKTHAPGGWVAGRFSSRDAAVAHAYGLCDSGRP